MTHTAARPRRVGRIVLVVLAVVGAGTVAVGALVSCSIFGCTVLSEDFEPRGEEATAARAQASAAVAALADGASVDGRVIATATRDHCSEGQNDWKRKDTYSHECTVEVSRVVAMVSDASADDPVADGLTRAAVTLERAGCRPSTWGGLDRVRDDYWGPGNPNVARAGAAGLPFARYDCVDGRQVEVAPTASRAPDDELRGSLGLARVGGDGDLATDWYGAEDLEELRRADVELALVVTASETYYRTRF